MNDLLSTIALTTGNTRWEHTCSFVREAGCGERYRRRAVRQLVPGFHAGTDGEAFWLDFWLTSEDLPDPENRVTLNGDGQIVLSLHSE